jgi:hypothetical protein
MLFSTALDFFVSFFIKKKRKILIISVLGEGEFALSGGVVQGGGQGQAQSPLALDAQLFTPTVLKPYQ